jgi:hypothetical protein
MDKSMNNGKPTQDKVPSKKGLHWFNQEFPDVAQ